MRILIATQNPDKFRIVKSLLSRCGLPDCEFKSLTDVNIASQTKEYGTLKNRALMKAQYAYAAIGKSKKFGAYIGIDDGMKYKDGDINENSKEITENILSNGFLEIGEKIINVRAFAFLNEEGRVLDQFEAEIPFKFIGNPRGIELQNAGYPLGYVLAPLEGDKPMREMETEKAMDYYLLFLGKYLKKSISKIKR